MINLKKPLIVIVLGIVGYVVMRVIVETVSPPPDNLGLTNGQLAPCPDTDNCVSSQADPNDTTHYIAPIAYQVEPSEAKAQLIEVLSSLPRANIVVDQSDYIRMETRSAFFGFIDDTEFYIDPEAQQIHVRAAARLGQSDLGVNRERVETIREKFQQAASQ